MKKEMLLSLIAPVVYVIIGIYTFFRGADAFETISMIISIGIICIGILDIIRFFASSPKQTIASNSLVYGSIILIVGIAFLIRKSYVAQFMTFILALLITINGLREMQNAIKIKRLKIFTPQTLLVVATLNIVFGIAMMMIQMRKENPLIALDTQIKVLGIGLVVSAVIDFVTSLVIFSTSAFRSFKEKRAEKAKEKEAENKSKEKETENKNNEKEAENKSNDKEPENTFSFSFGDTFSSFSDISSSDSETSSSDSNSTDSSESEEKDSIFNNLWKY
jgi:uncharacterized membrane protein HdeD (DUF308 family)